MDKKDEEGGNLMLKLTNACWINSEKRSTVRIKARIACKGKSSRSECENYSNTEIVIESVVSDALNLRRNRNKEKIKIKFVKSDKVAS